MMLGVPSAGDSGQKGMGERQSILGSVNTDTRLGSGVANLSGLTKDTRERLLRASKGALPASSSFFFALSDEPGRFAAELGISGDARFASAGGFEGSEAGAWSPCACDLERLVYS